MIFLNAVSIVGTCFEMSFLGATTLIRMIRMATSDSNKMVQTHLWHCGCHLMFLMSFIDKICQLHVHGDFVCVPVSSASAPEINGRP